MHWLEVLVWQTEVDVIFLDNNRIKMILIDFFIQHISVKISP